MVLDVESGLPLFGEQLADHEVVLLPDGAVQRRVAVVVDRVHLRARVQQQLHDVNVTSWNETHEEEAQRSSVVE